MQVSYYEKSKEPCLTTNMDHVKCNIKTVIITSDTKIKVRNDLISIWKQCIDEVVYGIIKMESYKIDNYINECKKEIENIKNGDYDKSIIFIQKALLIQCGVSIPFLA